MPYALRRPNAVEHVLNGADGGPLTDTVGRRKPVVRASMR